MKASFFAMTTTLLLAICCQSCFAQEVVKVLPASDYKIKLAQDSTIQLVDVRTPEEFATGHIDGAMNINYWGDDFQTAIQKLDKKRPVLLYCKSGVRSSKAAAVMQKLGFTELYNLEGGYLTWKTDK